MSYQIGTIAITAGVNTVQEAPSEGVKAILIGNESPLTVNIIMESGGVSKTLYPSTLDWFQVNQGFTGNIIIKPTAILNNGGQWPSSSLVFDAIGVNDPEQPNSYPLSLNRGINVGNNVGLGTAATSIANDGNAANTPIVEATVAGDGSSAVKITNDAQVTLGSVANPGSFTENGAATFNSTTTTKGAATFSGNVTLKQTATNQIGANKLTGISRFSGAADLNGLTIAHNYTGGTPNYIGISVHTSGGTPHAWSVANIGATNVTVFTDAPAGSPIAFDGIAMML